MPVSLRLGLGVTDPEVARPPNLSAFLFYETFPGAVAALNGRIAQKGGAHQASGTATMTAGSGVMKQAEAAGTAAGYDITPNLGQVPGKVVGGWIMTSGDFTYPATIGIGVNNSLLPMLHGQTTATTFATQLVAAGPTFIDPLYRVSSAPFSLSLGTKYRDELHYNGGKMAAMVKRAANGTILGKQLSYDFRMPGYVGNFAFWETLTNLINYSLETVEPTSDYVFPSVTEVIGKATPTTSDITLSVYGTGSVANAGGGVTITGGSYGAGGQVAPSFAIAQGGNAAVGFDAASYAGTANFEVTLIDLDNPGQLEQSNILYLGAAGRFSGVLTATKAMTRAAVHVVQWNGGGTTPSFVVSNVQVVKGLATSP